MYKYPGKKTNIPDFPMMEIPNHQRLREAIVSSIVDICSMKLDYTSEVAIEGLLGVTIDHKDIILVNVKEVVLASQPVAPYVHNNLVHELNLQQPTQLDMPTTPIKASQVRKTKRKGPPHKLPYEHRPKTPKQTHSEHDHLPTLASLLNGSGMADSPAEDLSSDLANCVEPFSEGGCNDVYENSHLVISDEDSQQSQWTSEETCAKEQGKAGAHSPEDSVEPVIVDSIVIDDDGNSQQEEMPPVPLAESQMMLTDQLLDSRLSSNSPVPCAPVYMLPAPPKRIVRKHDPQLIAELVHKIRSGTMTLADASRQYNIPRPTLSDKVRGRTPITKDKQNRRVLDPEEEEELVVWCLERASQGDMPCMSDFMKELDRYLVNHGRNSLANSKEWTKSFLRRHPELTDSGITFGLCVT